jgi:hypothetical protein
MYRIGKEAVQPQPYHGRQLNYVSVTARNGSTCSEREIANALQVIPVWIGG